MAIIAHTAVRKHKSYSGFWPNYPARPRLRTMAVAQRSGAIQLQGGELLHPKTWDEFRKLVEELNLELVIQTFANWHWFDEAAMHAKSYVVHGHNKCIRAIVLRGARNKRFWVSLGSLWGRQADLSLCRDLTRIAEATGIGQWSTPSRLGDALQRRAWARSHGRKIESRPNTTAQLPMLEHGIGGRGQTLYPGEHFTGTWELDQRDAYAAAWSLPKPHGPAIGVPDCTYPPAGTVTTWGPVEFTITEKLQCLAPLGVRLADGKLSWPTDPGTYRTWAWLEEVEDARSCGVEVHGAGRGVGWSGWTRETQWTQEIWELRQKAGGWGSLIKLATVASIGRHGRRREAWVQTATDHPGDFGYGGDAMYGQRHTDSPSITSWYSHALMQARRRLWHRAVAEQLAGRKIIAVETDSIILDGPPLGPVVKRGDDLPGEWSIRRENCGVWTPLLRWAIFDNGTARTPGLPKERRLAWAEAHAPP